MKALIAPNEPLSETTVRVCEVAEKTFPVAEPLFWVTCTKSIDPNTHAYDLAEKKFVVIEIKAPVYIGAPVVTDSQPITSGTVDL